MGVEVESGHEGGVAAAVAESSSVRKARVEERSRVAAALARAFYDDPVTTWMMPDDDRRMDRLERGFGLFLDRVYLSYDETFTTEQIAGAALWAPPGKWKQSVLAQLRLLPAMASVWRRDLPRVMRGLNLMESNHPEEPHYYLPLVGVEPGWQGRGIGTALLRPILERCDREGVAAYLEATSPRNRACYLRNGFEDVDTLELPDDGPPIVTMWREPQSAKTTLV